MSKVTWGPLFLLTLVLTSFSSWAQSSAAAASAPIAEAFVANPRQFVEDRVREQFDFAGLAAFYDGVRYYVVDGNRHYSADDDASHTLEAGQWLAIAGRFKVLVVQAPGLTFNVQEGVIHLEPAPDTETRPLVDARLVTNDELAAVAPDLEQLRFTHLWLPLKLLARLMEASIVAIQSFLDIGWGWAIVVFSVLLKIVLIPVGIWSVSLQRKVSEQQARLTPRIASIRGDHKGEEAHNRVMEAHKELGISPFYALKQFLPSLIQVPILVAVFNALGEMPQFAGAGFLWIRDLAYPDALAGLPVSIPLFGDTFNLMPFVMTAITIISTIIFRNRVAPPTEIRRQKRNLYLMAAAFFILFYPFPAVMVLYWALTNILQTIQQQVIRI